MSYVMNRSIFSTVGCNSTWVSEHVQGKRNQVNKANKREVKTKHPNFQDK